MINPIIVEDNDLFRNTLAKLLNEREELKCEDAFGSVEAALKAIVEGSVEPDVILLDIGLPGLNGVEGIPKFKALCPEVKIIMLTIHDDDDHIFKAICAGAAGYLLKDSPSEKILAAIDEVMKGGAPLNSHIAKRVLELFRELAPPTGDYNLTAREREILKLLVGGLNKRQISEKLFVSHHTIDSHVRHIYEKLEVYTRSGVVAKAVKERLL